MTLYVFILWSNTFWEVCPPTKADMKALLDYIRMRNRWLREREDGKMTSVLQNWLEEIPIRMQSTLILGLRGPDTHACPNVKKIGRWLRGLAFKPGNPDNVREFMGHMPERIVEKGPCAKELEFCSQHYYSHLMHALQVVSYRHPDSAIM